MLDSALEALKKFDYGSDLGALNPIEDAITSSHGKFDARQDLETRLVATLQGELSRDARDYVCRKLATVGTAASVPALAGLLTSAESSHMARFALEQIPAPEAAKALRDALGKASGQVKIGIITSLGGRRDAGAVHGLGLLLDDADAAIARAAALALGAIGNTDAVDQLQVALHPQNPEKIPTGARSTPLIDALLKCAESMLADNKLSDASRIYTAFTKDNQPRLVRLAGTRGLLAVASKQA